MRGNVTASERTCCAGWAWGWRRWGAATEINGNKRNGAKRVVVFRMDGAFLLVGRLVRVVMNEGNCG